MESSDILGLRAPSGKRLWGLFDWIAAGSAGASSGAINARKSLSRKFVLHTLALFSVFWIIYLPIQALITRHEENQHAKAHAVHILEATREAFRHAVWTFDSDAVLQLVHGIESFEFIASAWVETEEAVALGTPLLRPSAQTLAFDLKAPEGFERSEPIGTLFMVIDDVEINRSIVVTLISRVTLVALCLLVLALVMRVLFRRMIGDPLAEIADYISRPGLIENPPKAPLYRDREDEIGLVADTLKTLLERGHDNIQTLSACQSNLEDLVEERTEQLKNVQSELVQAENLAALGALVAGISHELNTPLGNALVAATTINDTTRSLSRELNDETLTRNNLCEQTARIEDAAAIIERTLGRVRELVGNFRQVAVDRQSEMRREFNFDRVIEETLATLTPSLRKTPYKIDLQLNADIEMDSYPGAISQVLSNLIENSIKHGFEDRPDGHISLRTRIVGGTGSPADGRAQSAIELVCEDDGIGIPKKNLKKVFEPFYTTKFGKGGSGLGMSIVYQLVTEVLNGAIVVESDAGRWTRFTVTIALEDAATGKPAATGEGPC